jgi:uncharacterized coiled-coil protein SlyX
MSVCSVPQGSAHNSARSADFSTVDELVRILTSQEKELRETKEKLRLTTEKNEKLERLVAIQEKKLKR